MQCFASLIGCMSAGKLTQIHQDKTNSLYSNEKRIWKAGEADKMTQVALQLMLC